MSALGQTDPTLQNPYGRYGTQYTGSDNQAYAWQALYQMLGRAPTDAEVAQASPSFQGADPNIANVSGGDAFVSQMVKAIQAQNPQQTQQTANQAAQQGQQNVGAQYQQLMPSIQQNYLNPLNQAIGQQGQNQQGLTQQAISTQQGLNQDYMNQLQGIDTQQTNTLQQLMGSQTSDLMRQLTDPSAGSQGQQMQNYYNGLGLLDSGAFNQGLATQFGNLAGQQSQEILQNQINQQGQLQQAAGQGQSALANINDQGYGTQSQLGLGGLNATQAALGMPLQQGLDQFGIQQNQSNNLANTLTGQMFNQTDFNQQSTLGQLLAQMGAPSALQKDLGMASGAAQGAGGLAGGAGAAAAATWICTAMVECNALLPFEVKKLHDHLYRAFWKRPIKFISYLIFGRFLVYLANKSGTNWFLWKQEFYDDVMAESDPVRAVDLYARTFWKLYANVAMNLEGRKLHASR